MSIFMSMSMPLKRAVLCPLRASSSHESTSLTYPVALEAILAAEVGLLAQLLTGRALQAAGIFIAVCTLAFALVVDGNFFCWCLIHGCGSNLEDRFRGKDWRGRILTGVSVIQLFFLQVGKDVVLLRV